MVCSSGGRTSSLKMAGLLLLLMTLATFGSCYLTDAGDSSPHNLARRQSSSSGDIQCFKGRSNWTYNEFEKCDTDPIFIDGGAGSIDLSSWSNDELKNIFNIKRLNGGFTIKNSLITGKGVMFQMVLGEYQNLIIENNANLVEFYMEISSSSTRPNVRISGNRLLSEESIRTIDDELVKPNKIAKDSHIQVYQECDLENKAVANVATTLKDCKAIYGDLIFDSKTVFPSDEAGWNKIEKLAYVQGCLRITGTNLASWKDLTFLDGTTSKGGCTTGHEITGNLEMCIHPPLTAELKKNLAGIKIDNNKECPPECTSRHVLEKADSTCVIITDSLVIDATTPKSGLYALRNVEEIQGLFQMINTSITHFTFLPKLRKLNSNKIGVGSVILLQHNTKLTWFDLPRLESNGLATGRVEQIKFRMENNGKFEVDGVFLTHMGVDSDSLIVQGITEDTTIDPADSSNSGQFTGQDRGDIVLASFLPMFIVAVLVAVATFCYAGIDEWRESKKARKRAKKPRKMKKTPTTTGTKTTATKLTNPVTGKNKAR